MNYLHHSNEFESPHENLAEAFIAVKAAGYQILGIDGHPVEPPESRYSGGQTRQWEKKLRAFISDPVNCGYDLYGYGFEFMAYRMLRHQFPWLTVLPTPADWDFVEAKSKLPSSDIVVGLTVGPGILKPVYFVRTALKEENADLIHPIAGVPLISVTAKGCMGKRQVEDTIFRFATTEFDTFCSTSAVPQQLAGLVDSRLSAF